MMDRLLREGNPPAGQLASPKPQYKKPGVDEYAPVEGQHGAPFAILKDASGAVVSPATEDKLEQVRQLLAGVATEAKLEQARGLLASISGKDFATQTTLAQVQSELALVKAGLQEIKANQLSGDQKVQLSGNIVSQTVLTQVLNASPTNHTQIFIVTPPVGELWKVKNVALNIPGPTNATSGKHRFVIRAFGSGPSYNIVDVESNFGDPIEIKGNILVGTGTKVPVTEIAQQNAIGMLVATNSMPLSIVYVNMTDVLQNNTMFLEIVKEVVLLG